MSREFDHDRLTPMEISAALAQLGIGAHDLAWITGTRRPTVTRWLLAVDDPQHLDPPFWLTQVLSLMTLPGGLDLARRVSSRYAIGRTDSEYA